MSGLLEAGKIQPLPPGGGEGKTRAAIHSTQFSLKEKEKQGTVCLQFAFKVQPWGPGLSASTVGQPERREECIVQVLRKFSNFKKPAGGLLFPVKSQTLM